MTLTLRQLTAYLEINDKIRRMEMANTLKIAAMGAQGKPDKIEEAVKRIAGG